MAIPYRSGNSFRQQPGDLSQQRDRWFESGSPQRRVSNEPSAGDLPEARRQAQCSLQKNGSTFLTLANQAECPMRLFWLHLADLFLGITAVAQFGFLGLSIKERHPRFPSPYAALSRPRKPAARDLRYHRVGLLPKLQVWPIAWRRQAARRPRFFLARHIPQRRRTAPLAACAGQRESSGAPRSNATGDFRAAHAPQL